MAYLIAVTQRVDLLNRGERRDALDQRWAEFVGALGAEMLLLPNSLQMASALLERFRPDGVILTGGNDLVSVGGDAPERDDTEKMILGWAMARRAPVLAVCRGMQMLVVQLAGSLKRIEGHVGVRHAIEMGHRKETVNSFHHWGVDALPPELVVLARAADGHIEAVRHVDFPVVGIMWHPEREQPFSSCDLHLAQELFGVHP